MNKRTYILTAFAVAILLAGCQDEKNVVTDKSVKVDPKELSVNTDKTALSARLLTNFEDEIGTRAMGNAPVQMVAPEIPSDAQPLINASSYDAGIAKVYALNSGKYYVGAGESIQCAIQINDAGNGIDLYVAGSLISDFQWWQGGNNINIYVLPGASFTYALDGYDNKAHVARGTFIYCWGDFSIYKNKEDMSTKYGLRIDEGAGFYMFAGSAEELYIPDNGQPTDQYNLGNASLDVKGILYSEIPVRVGGSALFDGGKAEFKSTFQTDANMWPSAGAQITFRLCATVLNELWFASPAQIDVYACLQTQSLNTVDHAGQNLKINLHNSLLVVLEDAFLEKDMEKNLIQGEGKNYSVVNIQGKLYINAGQDIGDITALQGLIDLYIENMQCGNKYWRPVSNEWNNYEIDREKVAFDDFVLFDGGTYLPGVDGCGQFGTKPEVELKGLLAVMPPTGEHRFSATSLDFNDELVYMSWHSNPKIETEKGGYIDVIRIDKYNILQNSLFEQSLYSSEFRFNHAKYYDGVVYGAATSFKVGAALAKVVLDDDGMIHSYPDVEVRRINLAGNSANCVEVIDNQLVTVSGWSSGALQVTGMTDAKPHDTYYEGKYQGKYICYNREADEILVLNNTDAGTVSIYDGAAALNSPKLSFNAGALDPYDGKNVCISDDQYIYVCRGFNGLSIFDKQGNLKAQTSEFDLQGDFILETSISANGVDVDDRYIYVAAGFGVIVYDKREIQGDEPVLLSPKAKTILVPREGDEHAASANYIRKGADGRLYVAYGIYGLRIYELVFE